MGGRGAGRSTAGSQYANARIFAPEYFRCAIMRLILGDIRNSIYREIVDRAEENEARGALKINDSQMVLAYGKNMINAVGFHKSSGEQKAKLKSLANYNCIIIEEAEEIPEDDFRQLDDSLRTVKGDIKIILLLNPPTKNHWILQRWFDLMPSDTQNFYIPKLKPEHTDTTFIYTDYRDNIANIANATEKLYEGYKATKPDHYNHMIRGLVPETAIGKIYNNWTIIDGVPDTAILVRRGLDFGYSIDPTVIEDVYTWQGGFVIDELTYQLELSNRTIADIIRGQKEKSLVVADREPKSIDEIALYGINIIGAVKGPGSVSQGIQFVQDQKIYITRRSVKTLIAYENYCWTVDKDGNIINKPDDRIHEWSNPMDAIRYALDSYRPRNKPKPQTDFGGTTGYIEGLL